MVKPTRVVLCFLLSAVFSLSFLSSSSEAKSISSDTVSTLQWFNIFEPFGIFDPDHDYLDEGINILEQLTSQAKARITGKTYASQKVDSLGITFILQRWTGSEWVDVTDAVDRSATNKDSYTTSVTWNVTEGYYYRAKTIHWIQHGTTYEQGERISSYILIES